MSKYPNDAKRLAILQDYLTSDLSKYAIAKKYQISRASILHWIRKFGLEDKPNAEFTNHMKENTPKAQLTPEEQTELERLRQENRELKQKYRKVRLENRDIKTRLAYETLGHKAYKELVKLAEETYDIEILKNSEAK